MNCLLPFCFFYLMEGFLYLFCFSYTYMPFDAFAYALGLVSSFFGLLWMALLVAVPVFLVSFPAQRLHSLIGKRFNLSWIVSAFLSCFLVLLPIVFVLYIVPFSLGYFESPLSGLVVPEGLQLTLLDYAMAFVATVFKNLLSALLFAVLLMPLLFFASFVGEWLEKRFKVHSLANRFIAVFLTSLLAWVIILFVFPWIVGAVFWKLYWGPV